MIELSIIKFLVRFSVYIFQHKKSKKLMSKLKIEMSIIKNLKIQQGQSKIWNKLTGIFELQTRAFIEIHNTVNDWQLIIRKLRDVMTSCWQIWTLARERNLIRVPFFLGHLVVTSHALPCNSMLIKDMTFYGPCMVWHGFDFSVRVHPNWGRYPNSMRIFS